MGKEGGAGNDGRFEGARWRQFQFVKGNFLDRAFTSNFISNEVPFLLSGFHVRVPALIGALWAVLLIVGIGASGCRGGELYMGLSTMGRTDSLEMTDERIREAFSKQPQLTDSLNRVVYSVGAFRRDTGLSNSLQFP